MWYIWKVNTHVCSTHTHAHTQRWRHTWKAWMLFSCSSSCLELKVLLLVVFDHTEMPYICQRKGDPTGTLLAQSYQYDVIFSFAHSLTSPSISRSLSRSLSLPCSIYWSSSLFLLPSIFLRSLLSSCTVIEKVILYIENGPVGNAQSDYLLMFCNVNKWASIKAQICFVTI